nr:MAG TPA: hypothetical protein [Caudoviricetes sp.]
MPLVRLLGCSKGLSGGFLGRERTLLLSRKAAVLFKDHEHVSTYTNRLAQGSLCAAEHLRGLCVAMLFGKFGKRDTAHCGVLNVETLSKYDRRYC